MNKRAITEMMLVTIVITIIGAVVFLTVLWPAFSGKLKTAQSQGECNWNLFLASAVKASSFGLANIDPGCKAQYTTVDSEELKKYHTLAKQRIKQYCKSQGYVGAAASTGQQYTTATAQLCTQGATYDDLNEWALNYIMAKKMTTCWDKVWHGKLDFFSRQAIYDRTVCVVCDVVSFSEDMPITVRNQQAITTLYDWMNAEPYYQTTYYDYISEGTTIKLDKTALEYTTKMPLAIVYVHTKTSALEKWIGPAIIAGELVALASAFLLPGLGPIVAPATTVILGAYKYASSDGNIKQLVIHPYELLPKKANSKERGLGCTDIIA